MAFEKNIGHDSNRNPLILMVPRDRIELPTRGFSELSEEFRGNNFRRLRGLSCMNFASFCNLYATICKALQRGVSPSLAQLKILRHCAF